MLNKTYFCQSDAANFLSNAQGLSNCWQNHRRVIEKGYELEAGMWPPKQLRRWEFRYYRHVLGAITIQHAGTPGWHALRFLGFTIPEDKDGKWLREFESFRDSVIEQLEQLGYELRARLPKVMEQNAPVQTIGPERIKSRDDPAHLMPKKPETLEDYRKKYHLFIRSQKELDQIVRDDRDDTRGLEYNPSSLAEIRDYMKDEHRVLHLSEKTLRKIIKLGEAGLLK